MSTVTMRIYFVDVEAEEDLATIALAEGEDVDSLQLTFDAGEDPGGEDDLSSYCVVLGGLTHYGGVLRADLADDVLTLEFGESAVKSFGLDSPVLSMRLEFEPDVVALLGRGFRAVFTSGPESFRPVLGGDLDRW